MDCCPFFRLSIHDLSDVMGRNRVRRLVPSLSALGATSHPESNVIWILPTTTLSCLKIIHLSSRGCEPFRNATTITPLTMKIPVPQNLHPPSGSMESSEANPLVAVQEPGRPTRTSDKRKNRKDAKRERERHPKRSSRTKRTSFHERWAPGLSHETLERCRRCRVEGR